MENTINKRERQAIETKQKLLETSMELIIKKGYDNVLVSEICTACNVAKGTFYTYFKSKKDIVIKILADVNDRIFLGREWNEKLSAAEQLMEYVTIYLEEIKNQGVDFTRVFLNIMFQEQFDEKAVKANLHEELVYGIIERGKVSGEFHSNITTERLCNYLIMFIFGLMMNWCSKNGTYDILEEGKRAVEAYIKML